MQPKILFPGEEIPERDWDELAGSSPTSSWFQTREAYLFFQSISFLEAFALGVERDGVLKGVLVGFIQKDGGKIKSFFSRRAIILGGPVLDDDISCEELTLLLDGVKRRLKGKAIYYETRNFSDYGKWRTVFERNGFSFEPHLNIQVHCEDWVEVERRMGKHRRRYIRMSIREGATILENPSLDQVRQYYSLLEDLYRTKVKMPLYPWPFFEALYQLESSRFLLIEYLGSIVGGSVCVCLNGKAVYEWFACGKDGLVKNVHPSSVTKYAGMRCAYDGQFPIFDMMGAGRPDEKYGVRDFKAEFGGELVEHGRFRYIANRLLFGIGSLAIQMMKKL